MSFPRCSSLHHILFVIPAVLTNDVTVADMASPPTVKKQKRIKRGMYRGAPHPPIPSPTSCFPHLRSSNHIFQSLMTLPPVSLFLLLPCFLFSRFVLLGSGHWIDLLSTYRLRSDLDRARMLFDCVGRRDKVRASRILKRLPL